MVKYQDREKHHKSEDSYHNRHARKGGPRAWKHALASKYHMHASDNYRMAARLHASGDSEGEKLHYEDAENYSNKANKASAEV